MRISKVAPLLFLVSASAANAENAGIEILEAGNLADGYLWTASFQRVDGSTCAWIEVRHGNVERLIYGQVSGLCRQEPPAEPDGVFEFTGRNGDRITFEGADFDVIQNTGSVLSGSWNHVSFASSFDVDNVVFRSFPAE